MRHTINREAWAHIDVRIRANEAEALWLRRRWVALGPPRDHAGLNRNDADAASISVMIRGYYFHREGRMLR